MIRNLVVAAVLAALLFPGYARGFVPLVTPVKIERVKPKEEKIPTLRFFKENLDFLRSSLDGLNQIPLDREGTADILDEDLLRYREMMEELAAARDTVDAEGALREREALLAGVTELAELESELDLLESLLADQENRLAVLEDDFLGRQATAVVVVVRGSGSLPTRGVEITDGFGEITRVALTETQKQSLAQGGILQIYHELVEPRSQTWTVSRTGATEPAEVSYLIFDPLRHRVNFLELDLGSADAEPALGAQAWSHPDPPPPGKGDGGR